MCVVWSCPQVFYFCWLWWWAKLIHSLHLEISQPTSRVQLCGQYCVWPQIGSLSVYTDSFENIMPEMHAWIFLPTFIYHSLIITLLVEGNILLYMN